MRFTGVALSFAASVALAACVAQDEQPEVSHRSALGEPTNGFPTAAERLGIMAINRARSDPQTVKGPNSATYAARPPVLWSYTLSRSARFHAMNLQLTGVSLMHSSPCPLNTNVATANCAGDPACACASPVPAMCAACATVDAVNTCGTDPFVRIGFFTAGTTTSANGEVAAAGYADPMTVVDGWMDEASGADGHRRNLTDQGITSTTMGYGHAVGGCFSTFDVSDSGNMTGATIPKLPTAAVRAPANNAAGSYAFYATWADPALGAPASLNVVIDGACTAMARELGGDKLNATYNATLALAAGCHNYYVVARDAAGATLLYPTTGAITIPVGSATACAADFLVTAPAATCVGDGGAPPPPVDAGTDLPRIDAGVDRGAGSGGATGAGGTGGASGAGGSTTGSGGASGGIGGSGGGATGGAGGSSGPMIDGGSSTSDGSPLAGATVSGGCSCDVPGGAPSSLASGTLAELALLLGTRRRRRAR